MLSKHTLKSSKDSSLQMHPSFVIKLYINPQEQTQISLTPYSDIDEVIYDCIAKYRLKKEAYPFLKQQITNFVHKPKFNQRCRTDYSQESKHVFSNSFCDHTNPLPKKQMVLRDIKIGDIDKNKISIQRTPKNAENTCLKKQISINQTNISKGNPRIYLKKKDEKQKQNIKQSTSFKINTCFKQLNNLNKSGQKISQLSNKMSRKKKQHFNGKTQYNDLAQLKQSASFQSQIQETAGIKIGKRMKTQSDLNCQMKMKEFCLQDLQKQMNEQVVDLKYEKRVRNVQPQLCNLFHSIIRYNPPKINRIDPRYACFDDLSQKVIKSLHQFLIKLVDDELNSLDFENFKLFLIKYRGDALLNSLK